MIVAAPDGNTCLAANLTTGGWSRLTGWDVACMEDLGGVGYFGSATGRVYLMDAGGSDDGNIYTAVFLGQHDAMDAYGAKKTVRQMRATFRFSTPFQPMIGATADFSLAIGSPPSVALGDGVDLWDVGLWDVALWDADGAEATQALWSSIGVTGTFIAPEVQVSFGSGLTPRVELVAIDAMYHAGALVA